MKTGQEKTTASWENQKKNPARKKQFRVNVTDTLYNMEWNEIKSNIH